MTMTSGPAKIDIEGTGEYPEAGDVVLAFKAGKLSFNHALRRMEEDFEITQEDALYVLWPPMEELEEQVPVEPEIDRTPAKITIHYTEEE